MIHVGTFNHDDLENRIDMAKVVAMQKKYPKYKYVQEKKIHKNGNMFLQVSILTEDEFLNSKEIGYNIRLF